MTQEQKAKAYDNIIEKANKMHSENCEACQMCIEELIPELKESEDEKIKEWLINLVKGHIEWLEDRIREQLSNGQVYGGELVKAKNSLAWLEKQGAHANFRNKIQIGDKVTRNEDGVLVNLSQLNRVAKKDEKQGVHKPVDVRTIGYWHVEDVEQKPTAWSEDDEMFVHGLIRGLAAKRDIHGHITFSSDCIDITDTINWLKSLKDRVQPQPKQEWSKEDETMITDLSVIVHTYFSEISGIPFKYDLSEDKIKTWLKSLRPQNTWKPSDEQMKALKEACDEHWEPDGLDPLYTLYQDLKKLREE